MANNQNNMTRRETLGGIALAGVAGLAAPVAALATPKPNQDDWRLALRRLDAAQREMDEANRVCNCAIDRFNALSPQIKKEMRQPLPWERLTDREVEFAYDTEKARFMVSRMKEPERSRWMNRLDAIDRFREQRKRVEVSCKVQAYSDALDAACERHGAAERAMWNTPAPDLQALHFKLDRMLGAKAVEEEGGEFAPGWHVTVTTPVMADVSRLLGA